MTLFAPTTNVTDSSSTGTIHTSANGDKVFIASDIKVVATTFVAIQGDQSDLTFIIQGTVVGFDTGIYFPFNSTTGVDLRIEAGAQVIGFNGRGVALYGAGMMDNAGRIYSPNGEAVSLSLQNQNAITHLSNTGTIEGSTSGINCFGTAGNYILENVGTIRGGTFSYQGSNQGLVDKITNSGKMFGQVTLGAGNDLYDGHAGHHYTGIIDGGVGNDTIKGGAEADQILGNLGRDILSGGGGHDVFFFKTINQSGANASTRDVITDFVHGSDDINLVTIDSVPGGANNAFVFDATRGNAGSAVAAGHVGWYWENNPGTANDHTIIKINGDADAAIESTIQLNGLISLTSGDFVL